MTRLIQWAAAVVDAPHPESEVHFHSGPGNGPAVCHDPRCARPRLDVDTG